MALVTITGNTIREAGTRKDNRIWRMRSVAYQYGGGTGGVITTGADWQELQPVAGTLTFTAEAGIAAFIRTPDNHEYLVRIPEANAGLWDVIEAGVAFPPNTTQDQLNAAVSAALPALVAIDLEDQVPGAVDADLAGREFTWEDAGGGEGYPAVGGVPIGDPRPWPAATWSGVAGKPTVSVKEYGAVGDGETDDRAAIHAARDAAGVDGTLIFPKGTYLVEMLDDEAVGYTYGSGGLVANVAGQTWDLGSATLVLAGDQPDNLITVDAQNVTITGGTLDLSGITPAYTYNAGIAVWSGTGPESADYGTHGTNAAGAVIRDVKINDAASFGVWILSTNSVTVTGCTMSDFYQVGVMVQTDVSETDDIYDFLIHGNRLETDSPEATALYVGANDQDTAAFTAAEARVRRARITGNSCVIPRGYVPDTLEQGAITVFHAEDCVIDGNVTDGGTMGITTGWQRRTSISNNVCRGFHAIGIEVSGGLEHVNVVGNVLDSDGAGGPFDATTGAPDAGGDDVQSITGITSSTVTPCKNFTISGNTITGFGTSARVSGIQLYNSERPSAGGAYENVTISGNGVTANGGSAKFHAVEVYAPTTNLTVTGNAIDGESRVNSVGVSIAEDVHVGMSITGNNFNNLDTAAVSLTGTFTDVRFSGNLVQNCAASLAGSGVATATRLVVDGTSPATSTATAAGTTTLTLDSTEVQQFTGSTTQTVVLPTTRILAGRRFTIINNSTGNVTVQSSAANNVEVMRPGTTATFVALQNTPTSYLHWFTTAVGDSIALNRLRQYSGSSQTGFQAEGFATDIAVNIYSKAAGAIRMRTTAGPTMFAATPVTSSVNWLAVYPSVTGVGPSLVAEGTDTNVDALVVPKGTGGIRNGAGSTAPGWYKGAGSPEGAVTAPPGSIYSNTSGGADTTLYAKESGTGNTGWSAMAGA